MIETFDDMLKKLKDEEPFAFSRWGDGEWSAVLGMEGANCDGHRYFPDMGKRLREVLWDNPPYTLGMQSKAQRDMGLRINSWLHTHLPMRNWADADILHDASIAGRMGEFVDATKEGRGRTMLVTSKPAKRLIKAFSWQVPLVLFIPPKNCWLASDYVMTELIRTRSRYDTVLYASSMATNVWMHDMHLMYPDLTQIDVGSALDPYCGESTRRYHKQILERENGET